MSNIDNYAAETWLNNLYKYIVNYPKGFFRAQTITEMPMDSQKDEDLDQMEEDGMTIWNRDKE